MTLPSYFASEEEQAFTLNVIKNEVFCLANEFQELYANANPSWVESVENFWDEEADEPKEIYQWFIVSTWLAQHLSEIGEPLLKTDSSLLWGRTCCGQDIKLDGTIQRIYRRLEEMDK